MAGAHVGSADRSRTEPRDCTRTRTTAAVNASTSGSTSACFQNFTGRKWYCRSGSASSGEDLVNRPASARFEVSGPRRAPNHLAYPDGDSARNSDLPDRTCQTTGTRGWSCRPCPTPGRPWTTSTPTSPRCSAGPMPESISSCGVLTAPPERTTSRVARATCTRPPLRYSTPVARPPSTSTRVVSAPVRTVRLGRLVAGCRYASADDQRRPRFWVTWYWPTPSWLGPLKSSLRG